MKKTIALSLIAIFIFSLIPLAFAESGGGPSGDVSANAEADAESGSGRLGVLVSAREIKEEHKERLRILKEDQRAKIEALNAEKIGRLSNLSSEKLRKIAELDKRQIDRLSALNMKNLDKITELKKERLERISKLSEEKLKRLAELDKEKLEKISDLNETEIEKLAVLNRARLKELAKLEKEKIKLELRAYKIIRVKNIKDLNDKNITDEELALLRQRFEDAKANLSAAKEELNEARKALKEAINERKEELVLLNSRFYLLKSINLLIFQLEKTKIVVKANEHISDEEEARIIADIDAQISDLNSFKAEVEAATTKEQFKELAGKLREKWRELREVKLLLHAEIVMVARVKGLVKRTEVLEKRLDKILARANEINISINVSLEMELFSEKIATAEDKYKQAQAKLAEAFNLSLTNETANIDTTKELIREVRELRKEAHEALKQAHDVLKIIVLRIRIAKLDADISADIEVEVVQ
ncbi:hypothetical protein J4448_02650 [Candidatus Woesearchaeota archaeon]|nr:hypothetical protein [Candidatus Woesearchaeota archaeon]